MGKVRNAANTLRTGRIGETSWYVRGGEQIVRQKLNNSNYGESARRSPAQQVRRSKWANLVNFYKVISDFEKKAFETLKAGESEYNRFIGLNIDFSSAFLQKSVADAGGCVAGPFRISQGTLPSLPVSVPQAGAPAFSLGISISVLDMETATLGDLAVDVINRNPAFENGDNIAVAFLEQSTDAAGIPRVGMIYREWTLDTSSRVSLEDFPLGLPSRTDSGMLSVECPESIQSACCGAAIVHTRMSDRLYVSSQNVILNNAGAYTEASTEAAMNAAMSSYGVDGTVLIAPGDDR